VKRSFGLAVTLGVLAPVAASAQFSSDIPGVPRAAISIRGGKQSRLEWAFTGYKIPNGSAAGDSLAEGLRFGFGSSYRIKNQFELGYDITLIDAHAVQPPSVKDATPGTTAPASKSYLRGLAAYGLRIGGKYRPIASLDPDGNGYEVAFGAAYQPALKPLYGIERLGDSTRQGGQFATSKGAQSTFFPTNPFTKLSGTTDLAAMGSYRTRRIIADAALVAERVADRDAALGPSPVGVFDGVSLRAGAAYRLTAGFAVGAAYWGTGSPPWRDEYRLVVPGTPKKDQYAFLLQFGSDREAGIDLMYTTPTGKYLESGRLYIRARSTR